MKEIVVTITETDENILQARAVDSLTGKILFDQFARSSPTDWGRLNFYYTKGVLSCELISGAYINPNGR